jgi:GAF domain-containing protein
MKGRRLPTAARGTGEDLARELDLLKEITRTIASSLDLGTVLNKIVRTVAQVTAAERCNIFLLEEDGRDLVLMESTSENRDGIGRIRMRPGEGNDPWASGEDVSKVIERNAHDDPLCRSLQDVPDEEFSAFLSVPVVNRGRMIGVINVWHRSRHCYPASLVSLVRTIAGQVGVAIMNARAHEEALRRGRQVGTLSDVASSISSNRYIEEILQLIVTMTAELLGSSICSIMLHDEKKGELFIAATQSLSSEYKSKPNLKIGQSISGKVLRIKKPVTVLDVRRDAEFMYPDLAEREGLVSMLSVPMMIRDRAVGVINAYTPAVHRFGEEEIKMLQGVANQAAVAIDNTRLLVKVLEMEDNIETRKVIERAKGILMKEEGYSEEEAYRAIHKKSMDTRKPMKEVAQALVLAKEIRQQ